jgi:hypothetical protein
MKKIIIGSFVGAVLLFAWQTLSWMVLNLHQSEYRYTPAQDTIMNVLNNSLAEDGQYVIPNVPVGTSHDEMEAKWKTWEGKPSAIVVYNKVKESNMPKQIITGFLICFICVWFCCMVIGKMANRNFLNAFTTALKFGLVCFLFVWYVGHNWMQTPWSVLKPELLDDLVGWGLVGVWLGWWYPRK